MPRPLKYSSAEARDAARQAQLRAAQQRYRSRAPAAPQDGLTISYYQPVPPQTQLYATNRSTGLATDSETPLPSQVPPPPTPPPPPPSFPSLGPSTYPQEPPRQEPAQQQTFDQFGFPSTLSDSAIAREEGGQANHQTPIQPQLIPAPRPGHQQDGNAQSTSTSAPGPSELEENLGGRQLDDLYLDDLFPHVREPAHLAAQLAEREATEAQLAGLLQQQLRFTPNNQRRQQQDTVAQPSPRTSSPPLTFGDSPTYHSAASPAQPSPPRPQSRAQQAARRSRSSASLQRAATGTRDIRSMFTARTSSPTSNTPDQRNDHRASLPPTLGSAAGRLHSLPPLPSAAGPAEASPARPATASPARPATASSQATTQAAEATAKPLHVYLTERLKRFPACSIQQHQATDGPTDQHLAHHGADDVSPTCGSLRDIANVLWSRPRTSVPAVAEPMDLDVDGNADTLPLPNTLDSKRIGLPSYPPGLDCRIAFEGYDARSPDKTPPRLCMSVHHGQTAADARPFLTSFDVDSICAFGTSLAAARQGIRWYPDMYPNFNITANVHLGLSVPPAATSADDRWRVVPLHTIPHYAFGKLVGWEAMMIYIFFPRLYKDLLPFERTTMNPTLLSGDQFSLWTDAVLVPAIHEATTTSDENGREVPDANILQHLPQSRVAAAHLTSARGELVARSRDANQSSGGDGTSARHQIVGEYLSATIVQRLTGILVAKVRENQECQPLFDDFVVYFTCKNTKLQFMTSRPPDAAATPDAAFPVVVQRFFEHWDKCFDEEFLDPDRVFIDLGKQTTAAVSGLPFDDNPGGAETFVYRNCCLQAAVHDREEWLSEHADHAEPPPDDGARSAPDAPTPPSPGAATPTEADEDEDEDQDYDARRERDIARGRPLFNRRKRRRIQEGNRPTSGKPQVAFYPWAMTGEVGNITITSAPNGVEVKGGLVYSQYYSLIKAPFDAQKVYALQPPVYENLAIDPLYLRQLRRAGRATVADQAALKKAYVLSKQRASVNLRECDNRSFGIREEHRISLTLLRQIHAGWASVEAPPGADDTPLPWFSIPTPDVLHFLRGQINRHCLLFEYLLGRAGPMFSLAETVPMVIALRGLRYCYGNNALYKETLLFGDEWTQEEWVPPEVLEEDAEGGDPGNPVGEEVEANGLRLRERQRTGLAMYRSMERHGFGWWRAGLFQWEFWRFRGPVTRRLLVGNLLLHAEYRRRWRAVREVRNIQVQLLQAQMWFQEHNLESRPAALATWLDYLHCLVLRQFDLDIWQEVHGQNKKYEELRPTAATTFAAGNPPVFCWDSMSELFFDRGIGDDQIPCGPHIVLGNKSAITTPVELIEFLFEWRDTVRRSGWSAANYRVSTQRIFVMISHFLGEEAAQKWFQDLLQLVLLTRWILPYPGGQSIFSFTKSHQAKGLTRRVMWFSTMVSPFETNQLRDYRTRTSLTGTYLPSPYNEDEPAVLRHTYLQDCLRESHHEFRRQAERGAPTWLVQGLLKAVGEMEDSFVCRWDMGKINCGYNRPFIPVVEAGYPPRLKTYDLIKEKRDLDDLDQWFSQVLERE